MAFATFLRRKKQDPETPAIPRTLEDVVADIHDVDGELGELGRRLLLLLQQHPECLPALVLGDRVFTPIVTPVQPREITELEVERAKLLQRWSGLLREHARLLEGRGT
jgi:hypothetical protein